MGKSVKYYSGLKRAWPLICAATYYSGIIWLFHKLRPKSKLILTYHNVLPDKLFDNSPHLYVSHKESTFRRHLDLIERYFSINHQIDGLKPGECAITFDDGYRANLLAAEMLEERGHRGVFFVPMEPLSSGRTLVIDQMLKWFSYVPVGRYELLDFEATIARDDQAARFAVFKEMFDRIFNKIELWDRVPNALETAFPFGNLNINEQMLKLRFEPMLMDTLRVLRAAGHTIGCHSWNHRPLAALDDDTLARDFDSAWKKSRGVCNTSIFCYPYGGPSEVDSRVVRAAEASGFSGAVVNVDLWPSKGGSNESYVQTRTTLTEGLDTCVLHAKLAGFEMWAKKLLSAFHFLRVAALRS